MRRAFVVAAISCLLGTGCTAEEGRNARQTPVPSSLSPIELTSSQPVAQVRIPTMDDAQYVFIRIISVRNPSGQGLVLRVSVASLEQQGAHTIVVGELAPFPPDHPAQFTLPLTKEAARALASDQHNSLIVTLAATHESLNSEIRLWLEVRVNGSTGS